MRLLSLVISISCVLVTHLGFAQTQEQSADSMKHALIRAQAALDSAAAQEQDILSKLDLQAAYLADLEKRIRLMDQSARSLDDSVARIANEIGRLEPHLASLDSVRIAITQRREPVARALARSLMRENRLGKWAVWDFLLGSRNLPDLLLRRSAVFRLGEMTSRRIAQSNDLLAKVNKAEDAYLNEAMRLETARTQHLASLTSLESRRAELNSARQTSKSLQQKLRANQKRIRNDRVLLKEQISQIKASLKQIDQVIAASTVSSGNSAAIVKLKGKLPWPALGKVVAKFGKSRSREYATVTENPGIDLGCEADSPVRVVSGGIVRSVTWLRGFGNVCIVEHDGGVFSVYARLSEVLVKPEQRIETQTTVGYPAFDAVGGGHEVHFEIWNGKEKQDPLTWLAQNN